MVLSTMVPSLDPPVAFYEASLPPKEAALGDRSTTADGKTRAS
jgi:hypothetical protein